MELKKGHGAFLFREGFVERARRNQEIPGQPSRKRKRKGIGKKSTSPRNNMPLHLAEKHAVVCGQERHADYDQRLRLMRDLSCGDKRF